MIETNDSDLIAFEENAKSKADEKYSEVTKFEFDKAIKEMNELNEELVKNLKSLDSAFSIGVGSDGLKAIKLGMVNDLDAVEKLASKIETEGRKIEESSMVNIFFDS